MRAKGSSSEALRVRTTLNGEGLQHQDGTTALLNAMRSDRTCLRPPRLVYEVVGDRAEGIGSECSPGRGVHVLHYAKREYEHPNARGIAKKASSRGDVQIQERLGERQHERVSIVRQAVRSSTVPSKPQQILAEKYSIFLGRVERDQLHATSAANPCLANDEPIAPDRNPSAAAYPRRKPSTVSKDHSFRPAIRAGSWRAV